MQLSDFEKHVIAALIDGDPEAATLTAQLAAAKVTARDYTGVGCFTTLAIDSGTPRLERAARYVEEIPKILLTHPALPAGAGAMLWLTDGRMDTLECYTFDGDWPTDETQFSISK